MNQGFQDDFKRDGFISQLMTRLARLEAFEREFRLKKFGAFLLPFGVYNQIMPITVSGRTPYLATVDRVLSMENWSQATYVSTTNDGANYWQIDLLRFSDNAVINTLDTSGMAPNTPTLLTDSTFAISSVDTSAVGVYVYCTIAAGAPGNLFIGGPALVVS